MSRKRGSRGKWYHDWQKQTFDDSLGICPYCFNRVGFKQWSLDHLDSVNRGGTHTAENLIGCCRDCNSLKSNRPLIVFFVYKQQHTESKKQEKFIRKLLKQGLLQLVESKIDE